MDTLWGLSIIIVAIESIEGYEVKYVGCLKRDHGGSAFKTQITDRRKLFLKKLHIKWCIEQCWHKREKYAGLQNSNFCYCSASTKETAKVLESSCNRRCPGNCQEVCGGKHTLSVYSTGYTTEPAFVMDKKALTQGLIGCYNSRGPRASAILCSRNFKPLITLRMTVPMCIYYCDAMYKAQFATLTGKSECCCSKSVHGAQQGELSWCNLPCEGDPTVKCYGWKSGHLQWSTYQISRLPAFKRWPMATFAEAEWLKVPIAKDQIFEITQISRSVSIDAADTTLSDLLPKKKHRKLTKDEEEEEEEEEEDESEKLLQSSQGEEKSQLPEDIRPEVIEGPKIKVVNPKEESESNFKGVFIGILVSVLVIIFLAAMTFYMIKRKEKKDEEEEDTEAAREEREARRNLKEEETEEDEEIEEGEASEEETAGEVSEEETAGESDEGETEGDEDIENDDEQGLLQ